MANISAARSRYEVKWADLDPIGHMRASVFTDFTTDARVRALASVGYPVDRMLDLAFGPVILRSESRFHHEVRAGDQLEVTVEPTALSEDGSHWIIRQRVYRVEGELVATIRVQGTWLDLEKRRPIPPPEDLLESMREIAGDSELKRLRGLAGRQDPIPDEPPT